jgi:hypothetical protein
MQRLARRDQAERLRAVAMGDAERVVIGTAWDYEAQAVRRAARAAALQQGGVFPGGRRQVTPQAAAAPRKGLVRGSDDEGGSSGGEEEEAPLMWFDSRGALVQAPVFVPATTAGGAGAAAGAGRQTAEGSSVDPVP